MWCYQLPIEHNSKIAGYWSLLKTSQKVMKTSLRNVKIIIIDEVSMVSSLNLAYIHLRLDELFGGKKYDICRQLQPVNGNSVFERITNKTISYVVPQLTYGETLSFMMNSLLMSVRKRMERSHQC